MPSLPVVAQTTLLLIASNVFMTFAWYAHLRNLNDRVWWIAAIASWGIALFEYCRYTQLCPPTASATPSCRSDS